MNQLDSVGLEFLDRSPIRVSQVRVINASVGDVFAAVATDPASWGKWCPGFNEASRWLTPMPPGVGSQREMHAFGMTIAETVLAFEHNQRFAFRVDTVGMPLMKAFLEEWTFAAVTNSPQATTATWTMASRLVIATTCHACLADHPNQGHDAHRDKATGTTCSAIGPATTIGAVSDPSPRPSRVAHASPRESHHSARVGFDDFLDLIVGDVR